MKMPTIQLKYALLSAVVTVAAVSAVVLQPAPTSTVKQTSEAEEVVTPTTVTTETTETVETTDPTAPPSETDPQAPPQNPPIPTVVKSAPKMCNYIYMDYLDTYSDGSTKVRATTERCAKIVTSVNRILYTAQPGDPYYVAKEPYQVWCDYTYDIGGFTHYHTNNSSHPAYRANCQYKVGDTTSLEL